MPGPLLILRARRAAVVGMLSHRDSAHSAPRRHGRTRDKLRLLYGVFCVWSAPRGEGRGPSVGNGCTMASQAWLGLGTPRSGDGVGIVWAEEARRGDEAGK